MTGTVFDGGEGAQSAAELNHYPVCSDHNDFLFGEAGDDNIYGGSGGDYMIGGQGNDSLDGGTGDDQIYGDGSADIGVLPARDLNHPGHDVNAGDALNNGLGDRHQSAAYGDFGGSRVVLGGHDTLLAGHSADIVSGHHLPE